MTAAWLNGVPVSAVDAFGRGLHYGDGVFRTLMKYDLQLIDINDHIKKICSDAAVLGIDPPDSAVLRADTESAAAGSARCVLKMMLLRSGGGRGYRPAGPHADRLLLRYPAPAYATTTWEQGIAAFRCTLELAAQPALAGIKHLNRLEQVLASRNWPDGMDEGLLGDQDGAPVCGTRSNLFWVRGGCLHTPALDRCGVAGVMRDRVLALAEGLGIVVRVGRHSWQQLLDADEAFITNSLIGIWPLRALEGRGWPAPGPLTARLACALQHPRLS